MDQRADELRQDIARRRRRISRNVDEVGNRVSPGRVMARGSYRVRQRAIDLRDEIMGNDEPDYPWQQRESDSGGTMSQTRQRASERVSDIADEASERMQEAAEAVGEIPETVRRQTQGNPLAAGLIAFGGGLLISSVFGPTSVERRAARSAQPLVEEAMDEAREVGREMAEEMKDSAQDSAEEVRDEARDAGERIREETSEAARITSEQARH
jgi:hypothetical protein